MGKGPVDEASNGLTCIPPRIHWAATEDATSDEIRRLQIEAFLQTLAEIALAIAKRTPNRNAKED